MHMSDQKRQVPQAGVSGNCELPDVGVLKTKSSLLEQFMVTAEPAFQPPTGVDFKALRGERLGCA